MSNRHFPNKLADYVEGSRAVPDKAAIQGHIKDLVESIIVKFPPVPKTPITEGKTDGGIYIGLPGMAYALWYVSRAGLFPENSARYLQTAKMYVEITFGKIFSKHVDPFDEVSFLLGNVGNYLAAAYVYDGLGEVDNQKAMLTKLSKAYQHCMPMEFHKHGSDEMFVGRAGYLTAIQNVQRTLQRGAPISDGIRQSLCETILTSGAEYAQRNRCQSRLMYSYYGDESLGSGHGIAGILLALLNEPFLLQNPEAIQQVRQSVDFVTHTQTPSGNFETSTDEILKRRPTDYELVHWCHGAGGVIYLLAKAYLVFKDQKYLAACERAADLLWDKGLLKKGAGLCHGISGNGYAFLMMYRLTGNQKYYHRALQFANFIFTREFELGARVPDEPYSLFEGWAGTICYLVDVLNPQQAEFPFMHVFPQ